MRKKVSIDVCVTLKSRSLLDVEQVLSFSNAEDLPLAYPEKITLTGVLRCIVRMMRCWIMLSKRNFLLILKAFLLVDRRRRKNKPKGRFWREVAERKKMYGCVAISCFAKVKSYIINM